MRSILSVFGVRCFGYGFARLGDLVLEVLSDG